MPAESLAKTLWHHGISNHTVDRQQIYFLPKKNTHTKNDQYFEKYSCMNKPNLTIWTTVRQS